MAAGTHASGADTPVAATDSAAATAIDASTATAAAALMCRADVALGRGAQESTWIEIDVFIHWLMTAAAAISQPNHNAAVHLSQIAAAADGTAAAIAAI